MAIRITGIKKTSAIGKTLELFAKKTAKALKRGDDDLAIVFVGESEITRLNRDYRHLDRPTDVLSFPSETKGDLGDVFICRSEARKKAAARGESYKEYLNLLVVHSVLHLGGYDHEKENDALKMEKMEKKVLTEVR